MIRKRLVATAVLALGTSAAAVIAAEPPMPSPAPVVQANQLPERVIKIEIGFEPWPLEEPPVSAPAPEPAPIPAPTVAPQAPAIMPTAVTPSAPAAVPIPTVAPDAPKHAGMTLAMLERMALGRTVAQALPQSGQRLALQPVSAMESIDTVVRPSGFVDQVVTASAVSSHKSLDQAQTLFQQYRLLNAVRLHYYHVLALQRLIAVREEL